ncbi:MAG TPA: energy-coupling factor ABC transporter permease [Chloroflexota bacterium]|nr:energy-coupling factor ABC transporter permease [Chloroflexota bacterium]
MTHVMVPDGVLPWWLSAAGWVLAAVLLGLSLWRLRGVEASRMVPLVGVMTALMVVIMSVELVPIGYELHLTALTGMVVGPWFGVIAALLFNVMRALVGDGAFTNIGLNTTITWLEIALGAALFAALRPLLLTRRPALAAGLATFASLLLATVAFIGVVFLSTADPGQLVHTGAYDVAAGGFRESPFAEGVLGVHLSEAHESEAGGGAETVSAGFGPFAVAVLVLGAVGATIEAVLTGAVVAFIARVRPELLRVPASPA